MTQKETLYLLVITCYSAATPAPQKPVTSQPKATMKLFSVSTDLPNAIKVHLLL